MSEHPYDELPGLLFGELNRAEVTVVSDHLAGCDDCRRELAMLAATSASLRATARRRLWTARSTPFPTRLRSPTPTGGLRPASGRWRLPRPPRPRTLAGPDGGDADR